MPLTSGTTLSCGLHECPSKCHQLYDHSKIRCEAVVSMICPKGHNQRKKCFEPILCVECDREAKAAEAKRQKEISRQQKCDEEEAEHLRRMKEIEHQLAEHQQLRRGAQLNEEPKNEIREKLADLEERKSMNHLSSPSSSMTMTVPPPCASSRSNPSRQSMAQTLAPPPQLVRAAPFPQTVKISHDSKRTSTETPATSGALSLSEAEWRLPPKQQLKTPRSAEDAHDNWMSGSDAVWSEVPRANAVSASKEKGFKEELSLVLQKDRAKRDELKRERESQRWKEIVAQRQREKLHAASKACREAHEKARELEVGRGTLFWRLRSESASPATAAASAAHSWTASLSTLTSSAQPPFRPFRSPVSPAPASPSTGLYIPPHRQT